MKHLASPRFWRHYRDLPETVRKLADKNFELLKADPRHPSLHLKRIDRVWSVRIGARYRRSELTHLMQSYGFGSARTPITTSSSNRRHRTNRWTRAAEA